MSAKSRNKNFTTRRQKMKDRERQRKRMEANQDRNMPKRPPRAHLLWMQLNRVLFATPEKNPIEVNREARAAWRGLSVAQKAPWQQMATETKLRYEEEMRQYNDNHGGHQ